MRLCADVYHVSHSHFLGGPPGWTQLDRDKAIWWDIRKRQKCEHCGTKEEDWDPELGGSWQAFRVATIRCRGCEVLAMFPDEILSDMGKGVSKYLERNPDA